MALFILILKLLLPAIIGLGAVAMMIRYWYLGKKCRDTKPAIGLVEGHLANCEIVDLKKSFADERDRLVMILTNEMEARVKTSEKNYIHFEFHSRFFGLIDDFEIFAVSGKDTKIEVRTAPRVGQAKLGLNRKRIEKFRTLINQ